MNEQRIQVWLGGGFWWVSQSPRPTPIPLCDSSRQLTASDSDNEVLALVTREYPGGGRQGFGATVEIWKGRDDQGEPGEGGEGGEG